MAIHKKNLLEAFQASAAVEKAEKAKAAASASSSAAKAGGPFARPQGTASAPAAPPTPAGAPEESLPARLARRAWTPDGLQRLIVLQLLITVAAFFLGRASVSTVDASEAESGGAQADEVQARLTPPATPALGERAAPSPQAATGAGAQVDSEPGTPYERALLDPENLYTVKLVEYRKGRDDQAALTTLQYLLDQGLPAVAQVQGGRLFILLGAAPTQKELDELLATAKTVSGPPPLSKPAEFDDAYVVGIDRLGIR